MQSYLMQSTWNYGTRNGNGGEYNFVIGVNCKQCVCIR